METNPILQQFNTTINEWITALDNYTLEQLRQQPHPNHWSLGQMYRHIIDDTTWFVEQIKLTLATDENSHQPMHEHARALFANNCFPDIKIEGPATNTFIPQPLSKQELLEGLLFIKNEVNHLHFQSSTGKTRHPGFLYFNALEWLQFAEMHMRHHVRQKKRIDAAI